MEYLYFGKEYSWQPRSELFTVIAARCEDTLQQKQQTIVFVGG